MLVVFRSAVLAILATVLIAFAMSATVSAQADRAGSFQIAQSTVTEKEAFEAAKELGTIEAWEAFLNNFPKGFRADLARAYVRRLGSETKTEPSATPTPASPPAVPPVQQQAATPPPPAPRLSPVDMGQGTGPWRIGTYGLDEGRTRTTAAMVDARGVRLTAYCTAQRTIPLIVSDLRNGIYPQFDQRVQQGLEAAGGAANNNATIPIIFQNGQQVFAQASVQGLTGELVLGDTPDGFNAGSPILEQIMSGNGMTVSMPPFGATFQLSGSRNAMCSLLRSCGAANFQSGCAAPAPQPVVNTPAAPRARPQQVNCSAGRVFSARLGKCVCPRSNPHFYGGRCRPVRDCPGDSVLNNRGQCVKENEPPRQQQVDTCPGDSVRNAQGICVKENEPAPQNNTQKLQCGILQVACAAGNQNACNNMASACR